MSETVFADAVVCDANVLLAICSKEEATCRQAENALENYAKAGTEFFAPNLVVGEVLYVLCRKLAEGILTESEHKLSVESFEQMMAAISTPEKGDDSLIKRSVEIREPYGCSRTADSVYIAFAEQISHSRTVEILTFDEGLSKHASKTVPMIPVNLLPVSSPES